MPSQPVFSEAYTIGLVARAHKADVSLYDRDPRGFLWQWEGPVDGATYVMGIDPSTGIPMWCREGRTSEDKKTNNGAIVVLRVGDPGRGIPDKQVAEWAGPVDPTDLGYIANAIGRLYHGREDDQCLCIGEITGPGPATLRAMVESGYTNQWFWQYYGDLQVSESKKIWWSATPTSLKDLWLKVIRHVSRHQVIVKSPFLVEEMVDARYDAEKMYAYSPNNYKGHGDRMRAFSLALWAANGWSMEFERTTEQVAPVKAFVDPQATDMTMEEYEELGWH